MKKHTLVFFLFIGILSFSQNKPLIYGLSEVPQSLLVNPGGLITYNKHFGIPFLSHVHINAGSSGVTVYDIFQSSATSDINSRITSAIFSMKNTDFFTFTQQLEIISIGWRNKNDYYFSTGMYQELDMITYFPRDLAILGWEGNGNYINYEFDFSELNTSGDLLTVFHFGANKRVTDKLTLGARVKVYSSIFNFKSTNNKGTFVTRLGDGSANIYDHLLENADVLVQTSGIAPLIDNDNINAPGDVLKYALGRAFLGGNLGVGLDLGTTYTYNKNWVFSASALDIGAIFHTKDVENYHASGSYNLTGINLLFPPLQEGEITFPYYENLEDEITEAVPIDTLYNSYTVLRPLKLHAGLLYNFGKIIDKGECDCLSMGNGSLSNQAIGIQWYTIFRPKKPQHAATLFYYRRITDFLSTKVTYTADSFSYDNIGIIAIGDFGKFNFYLGLDNILKYENIAKANSLSLQLGFNIKIEN